MGRAASVRAVASREDDEQFAWLENDLKNTGPKTPVLILSHIPIMAGCVWDSGATVTKDNNWEMNGSKMHSDLPRLGKLFLAHPNVKLCISGHIHLVDRYDYNGVSYLCNGAVCGNWWQGNYQETKPGYAIVDLWNDGTHKLEYVTY